MIKNELPTFVENITCAVTGHRILGKDYNRDCLYTTLNNACEMGYKYFLIGMAVGFDTECFHVLEELKTIYADLKIVAVVPCEDQSKSFTSIQKNEYNRMREVADLTVILSQNYFNGCMLKRNDFLVDNSSLIIAHLCLKHGGTYYTVKRANKLGVKVILI